MSEEMILEITKCNDCSNVVENPKTIRSWLDFSEMNQLCESGWKIVSIFHGAGKTFAQLQK